MSKKATRKSNRRASPKATPAIVTFGGKRHEAPSRVQARRFIKQQYNALIRDGKAKGKKASCMSKVPDAFLAKFKIDGEPAAAHVR